MALTSTGLDPVKPQVVHLRLSLPNVIRCQTSLNSLIYGASFRNYVRVTGHSGHCLKTPTLINRGFNDPSGTSEPYRLGLELFEMISKSVDQAQLHFFNQAVHAPYRDHPR